MYSTLPFLLTKTIDMEENKLIAEFMGDVFYKNTGHWYNSEGCDIAWAEDELQYHTSWDWLMPVVDKINSIKCKNNGYYGVEIYPNAVRIEDGDSNEIVLLNQTNERFETSKQATYQAVVEFIKLKQ